MYMDTNIVKIFSILDSLVEKKIKYVEVFNKEGDVLYKLKLILDDKDTVDFLDKIFDLGYKVRQISKKDFEDYDSEEILFHY
jgi:hypothetical protein